MAAKLTTPPQEKFYAAFAALVTIKGVRGTAALLHMSPATVSRIARGHDLDMETARQLYDEIGVCACCGRSTVSKSLSLKPEDGR